MALKNERTAFYFQQLSMESGSFCARKRRFSHPGTAAYEKTKVTAAYEKTIEAVFRYFDEVEKKLDSFYGDTAENDKRLDIMCSFANKTVKQWGSIPIRGFNQMTITSKCIPYCLQVLRNMANRSIKKSQKLERLPAKHQPDVGSIIQQSGDDDHLTQVHPQGHDFIATVDNLAIFPDKHGPDYGSTAFSGRPSGGGESSLDTCSDGLHTQGHDSAATTVTFELPSPAFNNKSSAGADQKPYQKSEIFLTTAFGSKPHGEESFHDSGGEAHIIQVDHRSHDFATSGSISVSNSSSVFADQRPYKNLVIFPDKCEPDVGSTAFRSQQSSGEQSSLGGGGGGEDSAATARSPEMASPALNSTQSASDQSVRASAPLENRDNDEQLPPDRSESNMEHGVAPSAERRPNPSSVAKICLFVNCEVCIAPSQIRYNAGTSLSPNVNILLLFVELFGVAGLLLCFGAYYFQRKRKTSAVMTVMGGVATICGLLSIVGTRFPEKGMLWLTAALCSLPIAASRFAFKELA